MTRLALLSCALLVACGGGGQQSQDPIYDFSGLDFARKGTDDAGPADLKGIDLAGPATDMASTDMAKAADLANPDAPVVTLTSPTTSVKSNNLTVTVSVTSPTSHTITGVTMIVASATTPTTLQQITSGVWQGATDVTMVPSGNVSIVVTATDDTSTSGSLTATIVLDHGPSIVFAQPTAATARTTIPVQVTITDPLGKAIDPANVTIGVQHPGDVTVTTLSSTASSLTLSGTITFNDSRYSPSLTGNQVITVTATNEDGATASAQKQFAVDQAGPTISIQSPGENLFAGGLVTVQATVDDTSGVNAASVYAEFAGEAAYKIALSPVAVGSDVYTALFDLSQLGSGYSYPTVSVTADDSLGNETTLGQPFYLDNEKPIISMNPPLIRTQRASDGVCSEPFNPVGNDVVQDGTNSVLQDITLRARIEDQANMVSGQDVLHPSGINAASVRLIAAPAPTADGATPVLVVNDKTVKGSTDCNAINPLLTPVASGAVTAGQYLSLAMGPITATGSPNYVPDTNPADIPAGCKAVGVAGSAAPLPMCTGLGAGTITYTLQYLNVPTPAIWSLPKITDSSDPQCVGQQFDDGNLPEGWACFAVIANDNIGNKAVSPPLRACIRRSSMANHPCDTQSEPDCRGTYTPASGSTPASTSASVKCAAINFTDSIREINQ